MLGARRLAPKGSTSREPARSSARPARSPPPTRLQPSRPPSRLLPRPQPKHCAPKRHSSFSSSQRSDSPARHPDFSHVQTPSSSCSQEHPARAPSQTTALPYRARDARSLASPCPHLIDRCCSTAAGLLKTCCEAWASAPQVGVERWSPWIHTRITCGAVRVLWECARGAVRVL